MKHVGYIMDGNRSWAKERNLPTFEGHRRGYENAKKIIKLSKKYGFSYVSFWALSDDNIRTRAEEEVKYLFRLLEKGIIDIAKDADRDNIRIICIGDRTLLTKKCVENMEKAEKMTEKNTSMTAIIAIGYGGQEEIARAVRSLAKTGVDMQTITTADILTNLETGVYPPPDLIIRTGGHKRHSGFFLFQSPYAEYYFSPKNWPDFDDSDIESALVQYNSAERKFGK